MMPGVVPNIKAAEKWQRQTETRAKRNLDVKTRLKTLFRKAKAGTVEGLQSAVEAQVDKAARKGVSHPNKAARKKARLARAITVAKAAAAAAPSAAPARKRAATKKKAS
jgi:small subunit ribosomal protein S20